jgi:hypothetical protein
VEACRTAAEEEGFEEENDVGPDGYLPFLTCLVQRHQLILPYFLPSLGLASASADMISADVEDELSPVRESASEHQQGASVTRSRTLPSRRGPGHGQQTSETSDSNADSSEQAQTMRERDTPRERPRVLKKQKRASSSQPTSTKGTIGGIVGS